MRFDQIYWKLAIDLYHAEKLEEAYDQAVETGMGAAAQYLHWFRIIEAEYVTAIRSNVTSIRNNAELEWIDDESGDFVEEIKAIALEAFDGVGAKLDFDHSSMVRLTVLAAETDAPWLDGRFGYCIQKKPFYKICIPIAIVNQRDVMLETLRHEYAHVVVGTIADRRAPRWLNEAVAQTISGEANAGLAAPFVQGAAKWQSPSSLEAAFNEPQSSQERRLAYAQSALIGAYLSNRFGEKSLGDMLRGFSDNSILQELWMRVRGVHSEEEAIEQVYELSTKELFKQAFEWMRAGR